jgi:hypothetical protein
MTTPGKTEPQVTQKLIPGKEGSLARETLSDDEAPALAVYEAAKKILGDSLDSWEGETVSLELDRLDLKASELNYNKILCLMALHNRTSLFTDVHDFQNVVAVFNNHVPHPETTQIFEAEEVVWTVVALNLLPDVEPVLFDYGPIEYIGGILHDEGFLSVPPGLKFAEETLLRLNRGKTEKDFPKEVAHSQQKKLERAITYTKEKFDELNRYLKKLKPTSEGL